MRNRFAKARKGKWRARRQNSPKLRTRRLGWGECKRASGNNTGGMLGLRGDVWSHDGQMMIHLNLIHSYYYTSSLWPRQIMKSQASSQTIGIGE